jgi:hypothetical protein
MPNVKPACPHATAAAPAVDQAHPGHDARLLGGIIETSGKPWKAGRLHGG